MTLPQKNIAMLGIHSCPIGELGTRDTGGMSVYIRELVAELGKRGHGVDIFTRYHGEKHGRMIALSENIRLVHIRAGDWDNMAKLSVYPYVKDYAHAVDDFSREVGVRYDLIHSHYWLSGLVGDYLSKWWKIPHMIMFHTLGAVKNTLGLGETEPECRICSEKALVRSCGKIIAPTIKEKQDTIQHYHAKPQKIAVVPCGVNQELFKPMDRPAARTRLGMNADENIILYVGRVEPLKGIERLIRATAWLKEKTGIKLLLVGGDDPGDPRMKDVRALVKELNLEGSIDFAGRVKQEELPYYYSAADALVVASMYESFGLVALEAMSCGTSVVSTPVGGMKTLVRQGQTGRIVSDDTVAGMGRAILDILEHRRDDKGRARIIRNSISGFSWKSIAAVMDGLYESLVSTSQGDTDTGASEVLLMSDGVS